MERRQVHAGESLNAAFQVEDVDKIAFGGCQSSLIYKVKNLRFVVKLKQCCTGVRSQFMLVPGKCWGGRFRRKALEGTRGQS
jgi:hypothetical protein